MWAFLTMCLARVAMLPQSTNLTSISRQYVDYHSSVQIICPPPYNIFPLLYWYLFCSFMQHINLATLSSSICSQKKCVSMWDTRPITTSDREISGLGCEGLISPYHERGLLNWRLGGEGGKVMSKFLPVRRAWQFFGMFWALITLPPDEELAILSFIL
jgi:hypothetical protein